MVKDEHCGIFQFEGGAIRYEDRGAGEPIIFAHGLSGNRLSWWQQVAYFSQRFRFISFSHKGFYDSNNSDGIFNVATMKDEILALADHLQVERFTLVAQSMSGWPALEIALNNASRLSAMVLCSTSGRIEPSYLDPTGVEEWFGWSKKTLDDCSITPGSVTDLILHQKRPELDYLYNQIQGLNQQADIPEIRTMLKKARNLDPSILSSIETPTLCIGGKLDLYFPSTALNALSSSLPKGDVVIMDDCGHSPYFQKPHEFNRIVADFLEYNIS